MLRRCCSAAWIIDRPPPSFLNNDHCPAPFYPSLFGWLWHHQVYLGLGAGIIPALLWNQLHSLAS